MFVNNPFFRTLDEGLESLESDEEVIFDRVNSLEQNVSVESGQDVISVYQSQLVERGTSTQRLEFQEKAKIRTDTFLEFSHSYSQSGKTLLLESQRANHFYRVQINWFNSQNINSGEMSLQDLKWYVDQLDQKKQERKHAVPTEQERLTEFRKELSRIINQNVGDDPFFSGLNQTNKNDFEMKLQENEEYKDSFLSVDNQEMKNLRVHRQKISKPTPEKLQNFKQKVGDLLDSVKRIYNISNYLYMQPLSE